MKARLSFTTILAILADSIGAFLLSVYALLIGPLGFLRGPLVLERAFWYMWVLLPQGLLARSIRIAIDWRLGHFDVAIVQAEALISQLEQAYKKKPESGLRRRVLFDLYSVLVRAYLHTGHIDEAMQVVIRSNKHLGVERLVGELDAKTAHLVRAGLAAGRLLDGGGLATMFVKTPTKHQPSPPERTSIKSHQSPSHPRSSSEEAKIIPFPKAQTPIPSPSS